MCYADKNHRWLATCPKGLEAILADELDVLGASNVKQTVAADHFECTQRHAYRICLWSRLANRILLALGNFSVDTEEQLYQCSGDVPWEEHLSEADTIAIDFSGTSPLILNTQFGAQRVKDAVVDRLRRVTGSRPTVDLNCLLYTSPSPRDVEESRMPSSA